MTKHSGVDFDKRVITYWEGCQKLLQEVFSMTQDEIEELIDAIPMDRYEELGGLVATLRQRRDFAPHRNATV